MSTKTVPQIIALSAVVGLVAGCANMTETQRGTATGAGIGAAAGAVVGAVAGGGRGAATGAAIGTAAGALGGYVWSKRMEEQKAKMEQATQGTGIGVSQTTDNRLKVNIPADAGFDTGRADIRPALRTVLDRFAGEMTAHAVTTIDIIGHTDSTGSDAINDPLSVARANSTRDFLVTRGVAASRIATAGRGEREPIASNDTDAGRAQNRRVEIFVAEAAPKQ